MGKEIAPNHSLPVDVLVGSSTSREGHPWLAGDVDPDQLERLFGMPRDAVVRRRVRDGYLTREATGLAGVPGMDLEASFR